MKVLVTGGGGAGSWEIRGRQIGDAMGATVKPRASLDDMRSADVILVVKKVPDELLDNLQRSGKPWVYDIIDAYPQPGCYPWSKTQSIDWLHAHLARLKPNRVIWPNDRMRRDAGDDGPVVYHHARPGLTVAPIRDRVRTIGYEGAPHYLDHWMHPIGEVCRKLNAAFVVNPVDYSVMDVVVALRAGKWAGYAQTHWKSNVKLANAHAAGVPFIGCYEDGYFETRSGEELFVEFFSDLESAVLQLESAVVRERVRKTFQLHARSLDQAAKETLCALKF